MSLMEKFADPDMMHSLSFADKMAGAGLTTLMGMGITFIILILLWFLISVITKALHGSKTKKEEPKPAQPVAAATENKSVEAAAAETAKAEEPDIMSSEESVDEIEDEQLVAVITAAIAAAQGSEIMSNLVIRNIRRVAGPTVTWARVGRQECIDSRKIY